MAMKATDAEVIAALKATGGVTAHAAKRLGLDRSGLGARIKANAELLAAQKEAEETVLDIAESVVVYHVKRKSLEAARYLLDRKGRRRGYVTRSEVSGPGGAPVQVASTTQTVDSPTTAEELALARRRFIDAGDDA